MYPSFHIYIMKAITESGLEESDQMGHTLALIKSFDIEHELNPQNNPRIDSEKKNLNW